MKDDTRLWPLHEESSLLRFQPVFTSQGHVHEYAVQGRNRPSQRGELKPFGLGAGLAASVAFFKKFKPPIPLSFEHPLDVNGGGCPAERLCAELGIGLVDNTLWVNKQTCYDGIAPLMIPAARMTFTLPLSAKLSNCTDSLARYPEFQSRLRVRLMPCSSNGKALEHGVLHTEGLHLNVPPGLFENRFLQGHFFTLMARARNAGLQVVASGVDDIRDFAWMRMHSDLLFRGTVLSVPLSPDCLNVWLQADSDAWRSFTASTTRFTE
ncbi:hypothetical protein [Achromobacter pestifer]|uniref:EAL domain-containing protein n=1 Tax=Achromobacter pestifer TaxID=1353889 RepID=A0A6S6Z1G7_9BURK|nr:hypothetical protein [Achromobacter pestifer]CAB3655401.1 hypothetical protein LMG3431_03072 [Achromobacter pestifer]